MHKIHLDKMSDSISISSKLAKSIFDQWLGLKNSSKYYKCHRCTGEQNFFESIYNVHPDDCAYPNRNCPPKHKNGIQAYLAVDATPKQGGIAFFTMCEDCFYYQPDFNELGIEINETKPTEFEMINLLIALCVFKSEILNHKTVRIIVDNNYLRKKGKMQRHAITEAIAAILEWCDNFGCTINEIFESNKAEDEPFMKIADRLSRNKEIQPWLEQKEETEVWDAVIHSEYSTICPRINEHILASINKILQESSKEKSQLCIAESSSSTSLNSRFQRMVQYFNSMSD